MKSLRKPKRLIIRGDDEREYKFLVKGGEDLRQDQRIEMVFTNMNQMMAKSRKCQRLSLVTYNIIPINTRWVSLLAEHVITLLAINRFYQNEIKLQCHTNF